MKGAEDAEQTKFISFIPRSVFFNPHTAAVAPVVGALPKSPVRPRTLQRKESHKHCSTRQLSDSRHPVCTSRVQSILSTLMTIGAVAFFIMDITSVGIMNTIIQSNPPRPTECGRRRWRVIQHLPVRVKGGEM